MRYAVKNFGCRATQADGAALEQQLRERGFQPASEALQADVLLVNTCTVTASADADARNWIRRARRKNPHVRMLVTGCYAQRAPEELAALPGVEWVVGNSHKSEIAALLECEAAPGQSPGQFLPVDQLRAAASSGPPVPKPSPRVLVGDVLRLKSVLVAPTFGSSGDRTRPTLKIQDGCNQRCAYCVIPSVRGRSRSLTMDEVLGQVRRLAEEGYREVVLSGVDLGAWGQDLAEKPGLVELTQRILDETSVPLLRFSSLEPTDLSDEFIELLGSSGRIARHLHAPLQSGSDRILRRMRRWYTREQYAERVERLAARWPNAGIGADIIVGFPGETGEDFEQTCELVERLPFTYLHVFSYSDRPGTQGARLDGKVAPAVIRERNRLLREMAARKARHFRARQVGTRLRALTLAATGEKGERFALSDNYLKLRVRGRKLVENKLLTVRVNAVSGDYLLASA